MWLRSRTPAEHRRRCHLGLRPGDGWGLFFYAELPPARWRPALACVWLGLLALPLGFWPAGLRRQILLAGLLALLAAVVPEVSPLAPARPGEILAPPVGAAAGALLRRLRGATARIGPARPDRRRHQSSDRVW